MTNQWLPELPAEGDRYAAIARAIAEDVASGRLRDGDRLPPQRELADLLGVSLGTVTRGYAEAERRGLIHGEGRRGTIVGGADDASASLASLASLVGPGSRMIDFGGNYPIYERDPALAPALRAVARRADADQLLRYPPTFGLPRHREVASAWMAAQGVEASAEDIILTAGAQHAIALTLSAVMVAGDVLLCEELTYPGVLAAAAAAGVIVKPVPMIDGGIDHNALGRLCRKYKPRALYCIPTLQNPTATTLLATRKDAIVRVARRHDLLIIEDEIHRLLEHTWAPSFLELAPERAFFITSVSKLVAGGLRLGFMVAPHAWRPRLTHAMHASMFTGCPLSAEVFATWWEDGTAMRTVEAKRKEARARQRVADAYLSTLGDLVRYDSANSYHLWVELCGGPSIDQLIARAAQRGVSLLPPSTFAVAQAPRAIRLSLGAPETRNDLEEGLGVICSILVGQPPALAL